MGYVFSTKEHSFVDDVRRYGWRVALWNTTFILTSWLFRKQGGTGITVRGTVHKGAK